MAERENEIKFILQKTEAFATPFLEQGRGGWDIAHTKAVVYYAGLLAKNEGQDTVVLQIAAWLHDIGYFGQFTESDGSNYSAVKDKKELHMQIGSEMARKFLESGEMTLLTTEQRERTVHLVEVHDKLEELEALDEIILMEADTLGAIDLDRVIPSFDKEGQIKYADGLRKRRQPKFRTQSGIIILDQLLPKFEEYDPVN